MSVERHIESDPDNVSYKNDVDMVMTFMKNFRLDNNDLRMAQDLLEKYGVDRHDPDETAEIMREKGWSRDAAGMWTKNGERFKILIDIFPFFQDLAPVLVAQLRQAGFDAGFRMTTDQLQIKRATRGKALRFNFGASIHRVVGIDLSDPAFEPDSTEIRIQWRPRLDLLLEELRKAPSVLRLSYVADTEDATLVERRVDAVKRQVTEAWNAADGGHPLTIELEVFWRRGAPPQRRDVRARDGR